MNVHVLKHVYCQLALFLKVAIKMQIRINLKDKTTERKELETTEITKKY